MSNHWKDEQNALDNEVENQLIEQRLLDQKFFSCFICEGESDHRDRFVGRYHLCTNPQCETDLEGYLTDMGEINR